MCRTVTILVLPFCALAAPVAAAPELAVDSATFTFLDTIEGLSVSHAFVLTNPGDQATIITSAAPSCSCTRITAAFQEYRLAPGESVQLNAILDTEGTTGFVSKKLIVRSNAPGPKGDYEVELYFEGNVAERPPYQESVASLSYDFLLLIDVRDPASYAAGHLIGAMNVPATQIASSAPGLPAAAPVLIYDETGSEPALSTVTEALHSAGVASVYSLQGGLSHWKSQYGASRMAYGDDPSWGSFLDEPGAQTHTQSTAARPYYIGQLLRDFILVDLRSPEEYTTGHLAGAINLQEADLDAWAKTLRREIPIVAYSADGTASDRAASLLWKQGRNVASLLGGLDEWRAQHGSYLLVASSN